MSARKKATAAVRIEIVAGVAGLAVYIDDRRVAGPKPWGGGPTIHSFKAEREDVLEALNAARGEA